MGKIIPIKEAISLVKDGDTIMIGGFLANGAPEKLIDALVESGRKDLTLICNDTAYVDRGSGKLVVNKQVKKIIASHVGTNKETGRQMAAGETEVDLVPQGTLAERIRAKGFGLGGILTPTGLGTLVEEGKQKIVVNGRTYLLEVPLGADIAFLFADTVDTVGNMVYKGTENAFTHVMASAANITVVEARNLVEKGEINPNAVVTPGIFVNYIVDGGRTNG